MKIITKKVIAAVICYASTVSFTIGSSNMIQSDFEIKRINEQMCTKDVKRLEELMREFPDLPSVPFQYEPSEKRTDNLRDEWNTLLQKGVLSDRNNYASLMNKETRRNKISFLTAYLSAPILLCGLAAAYLFGRQRET